MPRRKRRAPVGHPVLALVASVIRALFDGGPSQVAGSMMFMAAYTSVGVFGLHPAAPRLVKPGFGVRDDTLSYGRLSAERSRIEEALRHEVTVDPLTGLSNRRAFLDRLTGELAQRQRCTVLFCDLDGFKAIWPRRPSPSG